MNSRLIEKLACLEHVQWEGWAGSVGGDIETLIEIIEEHVPLDELTSQQLEVVQRNRKRVENWPKLMVPYSELSEEMKEKDRVYARKVYEACKDEL